MARKIKLLVSIRSIEEIKAIEDIDIDIVDIKDPENGPLGMLDLTEVEKIVQALVSSTYRGKISTTFELNKQTISTSGINKMVDLSRLRIDYIKVGTAVDIDTRKTLTEFNQRFLKLKNPVKKNNLILVLTIDEKYSVKNITNIFEIDLTNFCGIMVDTFNKNRGSIFEIIRIEDLEEIKNLALENEKDFGIAGSLQISHKNLIKKIEPNWAGYRGSLCLKKRTCPLSREKVERLITVFDRY